MGDAIIANPDDKGLRLEYSEGNGLCEADDVHSTDAFVVLLTEVCERPEGAVGE